MYCTECGTKFEGKFCPKCGKSILVPDKLRDNLPIKTEHCEIETTGTQAPKKKGVLHYLKLAVLWYLVASFGLSGISVVVSGVSVLTGILWVTDAAVICPLLFKNLNGWIKGGFAVGLFLIGAMLMV